MVNPRLVQKIIGGYALPVLGTHGVPHWARVLENGLRLAEQTGAHREVVALFAVFHDSRRVNEGTDPGHGRRGAELARQLRHDFAGLDERALELLVTACAHHTDGAVDGDVTVRTCWDADRLDLWRVYVEPDDALLCTAEAKSSAIRDWSRERSVAGYTPAYALEDWVRGLNDRGHR